MDFKLKHLDIIAEEKVNYFVLIKEVSGFDKWRFWKVFHFIKSFKKIHAQVTNLRNIDLKNITEFPDCEIKRPENIDLIPFTAMIELQLLFGNQNSPDREIGDLMTETIAMACFSSNYNIPFDSDSEYFRLFKERVGNSNMLHMIGLYKWIDSAVSESSKFWERSFFEVEVVDRDYELAGGAKMNQFNVLMTIKNTCNDFNVPYKEALQMPYGMTQANSLAKATQGHIQHIMSQSIEARMRSEREKNK